MNCFEWQTRASEILDGTLVGTMQRESEQHLDECPECKERHSHYRQILSSISTQARVTLPITIRKAPLSFILPRLDPMSRKSKWERAPWYVRTGIEGLGVAFMIAFVMTMVPRLRGLYEKAQEKKLDFFSLIEPSGDSKDTKNNPAHLATDIALSPELAQTADDFSSENEGDTEELEDSSEDASQLGQASQSEVHAEKSEIWRFNLKTDSPHEFQPKVKDLLLGLKIPPNFPGLNGTRAPGGIQFDLLVSPELIPSIKTQLETLASAQGAPEKDSASEAPLRPDGANSPFTWFKNKSKKPLPPGRARVVIWIYQF